MESPVEGEVKTSEELLDKKRESQYWDGWKKVDVLKALKDGMTLPQIAKGLSLRPDFLERLLTNPYFLKKIESHMTVVVFSHQLNKLLAISEVFKYFWDVTMGKIKSEDFSPNQAAKHLLQLMNLQQDTPSIINPQQFNFFMKVMKKHPEILDSAKEFGFDKLNLEPPEKSLTVDPDATPFNEYEQSGTNLGMDQREEDSDKQGTESGV